MEDGGMKIEVLKDIKLLNTIQLNMIIYLKLFRVSIFHLIFQHFARPSNHKAKIEIQKLPEPPSPNILTSILYFHH
ncbi:hypothetical protein NZD88_15520 [Chryseobacterium antibioticum]|uniref:Uncharacterized protein n=1 Tax=Chryseobacterium pyrolae TaxID=2987481 RepID=A0ABT2IJX5_9FLAO|nr:hypothetical protein [Chryseobacterium pyrolae]MCT2408955.1 hypothetical protein [Chryseobacterium pyrolae]